jgi:ABC-type sugar transport system substrate-binding protein
MRKTMLTSVCAVVIGLSGFTAASAQTAGAPANNQTNVASPATTDNGSMNAMNKTTKKKTKMKKDTKTDGGAMEKKM